MKKRFLSVLTALLILGTALVSVFPLHAHADFTCPGCGEFLGGHDFCAHC